MSYSFKRLVFFNLKLFNYKGILENLRIYLKIF